MNSERHFDGAWLVLSRGFPNVRANIRLSRDAILKVPHVDSDGILCFSGDVGPASGASPEDRLQDMLYHFSEDFLKPWQSGQLDADFETETLNYWGINVGRHSSTANPVRMIFTIDERPCAPRLIEATLVHPMRAVIVGSPKALEERVRLSLGGRATRIERLGVLDIPVDVPLTPQTWPKNQRDLELLLEMRVDDSMLRQFNSVKRRGAQHRLVVLRSLSGNYGYLLPGGPLQEIKMHKSTHARPNIQILPLSVYRLDPSWTTGRDANHQVLKRQLSQILVIGAGALGSQIIDQLARAGIGGITVVDDDYMTSANVGRHLLGVEAIDTKKAQSVAEHVRRANPSCCVNASSMTAEDWLERNSLSGFALVLDLTGEPDVRFALSSKRLSEPVPLVVGWMEPYVAAAHACILVACKNWFASGADPLEKLQSVVWPDDVFQNEPGCSSRFQSYTPAAAAYAVGLVVEAALDVIDKNISASVVRSWVRGQRYLDSQRKGLRHRDWVNVPKESNGALVERAFDV
ncbi:ThiF family adenylyltransferase [Massilia sp. SR12]